MAKKKSGVDWKKKRNKPYLEEVEHFYIFCEGEKTEPNYFNGIKKEIEKRPVYKNMVEIKIQPCKCGTMGVLNAAKSYVKNNKVKDGQVWCVYDKDDFPASNFDGVCDKIDELNKDSGDIKYHAAWSNECVEFWFILHFDNYRANNSRSEYIKYLNNKFKKLGYKKYEKNMDDIYNILIEKGNQDNAIKFAKRILEDNKGKKPSEITPGTRIFELVESLSEFIV